MQIKSNIRRRRTIGAFLALVGAAQFALTAVAPPVEAVVAPPGNVLGFEAEGNHLLDGPPDGALIDWETIAPQVTVIHDQLVAGFDGGFQGSSKESAPADWVCNQTKDGVNPPKANLLRAYFYPGLSMDKGLLAMGFIRQNSNSGTVTGDTYVNVELNQGAVSFDPATCDYSGRMLEDLLFEFTFPGNGAADVVVSKWNGTNWDAAPIDAAVLAGLVRGGDNSASSITDEVLGGSIDQRAFGEVAMDFIGLRRAVSPGQTGCLAYSSVSLRSKSSQGGGPSALQDHIAPQPMPLSTCGSVTLTKIDDKGNPLAGIDFQLFDGNTVKSTCTTDANGVCKFTNVEPGTYSVLEVLATVPAGYQAATNPVATGVVVKNLEDVVIAVPVVNPRLLGDLEITKAIKGVGNPDPKLLEGATFVVYSDTNSNGSLEPGEEVSTWAGAPATCTIATGDSSCSITGIPTGDYRVSETAVPTGTQAAADQNVSITAGTKATLTFENTVGSIDLVKSGPGTADIGTTVTYTFTVTNTGSSDLTDVVLEDLGWNGDDRCDSAPVRTSGSGTVLAGGASWTYTCDFTITEAAVDAGFVDNDAKVTGKDAGGTSFTDTDAHRVAVRRPALSIAKTPDNGVIDAGDVATFTIVVTSTGQAVARDVEITDVLPAGFAWADITPCTATGNTLSCGDLAPGKEFRVTATKTTAFADCGVVPNTAKAVADFATEVSDGGQITVECPALTVTKTPDGATVDTGDPAVFTVTVGNAGPGTATDVVITDQLPAGFAWTALDGCTVDPAAADRVLCGDLLAGDSKVLTASRTAVVADCATPIPNTAAVAATNHARVSDSASIQVRCPAPPPPPAPVTPQPNPAIGLDKTGPEMVHRGDEVVYFLTATNLGDTPLVTVTVTDPRCDDGTLTKVDDADGDTVLGLGESWIFRCTHVVTDADEDPLPNTALATGATAGGVDVTATDEHLVDVIEPVIEVDKSVDNEGPQPGDTITFSYSVLNSGDITLFDVEVTDDVLGLIGVIPELLPGQTIVLTATQVVTADQPLRNVVLVRGTDPLDLVVSATDDQTISIVLPSTVTAPLPELPRTGTTTATLLMLAGLLLLSGGSLNLASMLAAAKRRA